MSNTLLTPEAPGTTQPSAEVLADSVWPERRVVAIDGISLPDLNALRDDNVYESILYDLYPADGEPEFVLQNSPSESETEDYERRDHGLKRWVAESLQACNFNIPEEGVEVMFDFTYLNSTPEEDVAAGKWHTDGVLLTLTVFEDNSTEVLDGTAQDAMPEATPKPEPGYYHERGLTSEQVIALTGIKPEEHALSGSPGQTLAIGPDATHRTPARPAGVVRSGIVCFIGYSG